MLKLMSLIAASRSPAVCVSDVVNAAAAAAVLLPAGSAERWRRPSGG